jgi:hypothetical protein
VVSVILTIGVDLGQEADPSAVTAGEWVDLNYEVRKHATLPLGTSYADIGALLARGAVNLRNDRMVQDDRLGSVDPSRYLVAIYIDATNQAAALELIAAAVPADVAVLIPVKFEAGDYLRQKVKHSGWLWYHVGKEYHVTHLITILEQGRVRYDAQDPEIQALMKELQAYRRHLRAGSRTATYSAPSGKHDDRLTSLGLATLDEPEPDGAMREIQEMDSMLAGSGAFERDADLSLTGYRTDSADGLEPISGGDFGWRF